MRPFPRNLLACGLLFLGFAAFAPARSQEEISEKPAGGMMFGVESDFNSKYIWRSLAWSEGAVWQPGLWIGWSGFTLSVWNNFVLHKEANYGQFNEVDYRLSYKKTWGRWTIEPAFQVYAYPHQPREPATGELSVQVAYDLSPFALETTHYFDLIEFRGAWIGEVGLQFQHELTPSLTLDSAARILVANAKFNDVYTLWRKSALNSVILEMSLTCNLTDFLTIRPHFEWNRILDGDLRSWLGRSSLLNFGIAIGVEY